MLKSANDHDVLLVYDEEERNKKNFIICVTEEASITAIGRYIQKPDEIDEMSSDDIKKSTSDSNTYSKSKFESSYSTEEEIRQENVFLNRELVILVCSE